MLLGRKFDGSTFFGHVDDAATQTDAVAEDVGDFVYINSLPLSTFFNVPAAQTKAPVLAIAGALSASRG